MMHSIYIKINDPLSFFKFYHPEIGVLNQAILHSWWPYFNLEVTILILKLTGEYLRGEECTGFWWGNLRERDHWGDPDADGRIILRWIFRKWEGGCGNWMELAQDRDRWRALVSTVMNLRIPKMRGIS